MSGKKLVICKECGAKCDFDEIDYKNTCFDCVEIFCELGGETHEQKDTESRL